MEMQTQWSEEELALKERFTTNTYKSAEGASGYGGNDSEAASVGYFTEDAISCAGGHPAMVGHKVLHAWHKRRLDGHHVRVHTICQHVNIVGELAIVGGVFRISRDAEEGLPGVEHGGRWLSVLKKVDGQWLTLRDMDTPSSDAQVLYKDPVDVALGWVRAELPEV